MGDRSLRATIMRRATSSSCRALSAPRRFGATGRAGRLPLAAGRCGALSLSLPSHQRGADPHLLWRVAAARRAPALGAVRSSLSTHASCAAVAGRRSSRARRRLSGPEATLARRREVALGTRCRSQSRERRRAARVAPHRPEASAAYRGGACSRGALSLLGAAGTAGARHRQANGGAAAWLGHGGASRAAITAAQKCQVRLAVAMWRNGRASPTSWWRAPTDSSLPNTALKRMPTERW